MSIDPVCGMRVDRGSAAARCEHESMEYLFCSESCMRSFLAHPERYLDAGGHAPHRHAGEHDGYD